MFYDHGFDPAYEAWVKIERQKEAEIKRQEQKEMREYKKHPAKILNKRLYWDVSLIYELATSVQASIEKEKAKVPDDFNEALDTMITSMADYIECIEKHIGVVK